MTRDLKPRSESEAVSASLAGSQTLERKSQPLREEPKAGDPLVGSPTFPARRGAERAGVFVVGLGDISGRLRSATAEGQDAAGKCRKRRKRS